MTTSVSRRTKKKKITFDLDKLVVQIKRDKWDYGYVSAVYYNNQRIKRYKASARYIYKINDCIVKIEPDLEPDEYRGQTRNEVNFYKLIKRKDNVYFPQLITYNLERGIVVQEYIDFSKSKRTKASRDIIEQLIVKYQIDCDISSIDNYNWAINKKTNLPVIYDLGYY